MTKHLRLPCLASLIALSLLAASAFGQGASPAKQTKTTLAPFDLRVTQVDSPQLNRALRAADTARQGYKAGNVSKEVVADLEAEAEIMTRLTPFILDVRSHGGPLSTFVTEAAKVDRYSGLMSFTLINAADPADLETPLPPFELKNANWGTVIGVLGHLLNPRGLDLRFVGGDNPDPAAAKSVVCVLRRTDAASDAKRTAKSELESFQIGDNIFKEQTVEVIVDAIRSAWELEPANDPAALRIKFHAATKLLLVSGPAPATHIARQVISGLKKKPAPIL